MKKLRIKFLALLLITSVAFLSCKKEDRLTPINRNTTSATTTNPVINRADWRITLFQENGVNKTKSYSKYLFEFADNGILKAIMKNNTVIGSWSAGQHNNPQNFLISFPSEPLSNLNNTAWQIMSRTSSDLMLEYKNRKSGEVVYLTFQRPRQLIDSGLNEQNPN